MPPRTALGSPAVKALHVRSYVCPSCLVKQGLRQESSRAKGTHSNATKSSEAAARTVTGKARSPISYLSRRHATNYALASTTAIGAPTGVPPHLRNLYQRLLFLQDKASSYVDLSRLQLALRGLESEDPIIRVAFLGLGNNGVRAARQLAKVMLADELGSEEHWERELTADEDGRSVLLRYGELGEVAGVKGTSSPLVREITIPSARLRGWRLEILITGMSAGEYPPSVGAAAAESAKEREDSILVPPVTIPNSSGGRVGFVRYPAHKALVVADGLDGAIEYGRLASAMADGRLINAALSLPLRAQSARTPLASSCSGHLAHTNAISIDLAEHALNEFRTDIANGAVYSESWQQSRVATISDWLAASNDGTEELGLKAAVKDILTSTLARASDAIGIAEMTAETMSTALAIPETKRSSVNFAIASWSAEAHRDLQMNLNTAFVSPTWRRTTWWRLFWRIDEVSISGNDVLRRGWLVEAEQGLAFLSGRMLEAGLARSEDLKGGSASVNETTLSGPVIETVTDKASDATEIPGTFAQLLQTPPSYFADIRTESDPSFDPPWPRTIQLARDFKLHKAVPAMHRKAQALLLACLSTMGGAGALAGWLWVASGGVALYESGAIAALGFVWSLRRLQKVWGKERQEFVETTKEDGRLVLSHVENHLRELVHNGGRMSVSEDDKKQWEEAREALQACETELSKLEKPARSPVKA